jgi:hypothetical protein
MAEDADAAQAHVLAEALRDHIAAMSARLAKVDTTDADHATHLAVNELGRDIDKARFLIERLRRRFPDVDAVGESDGVAD